VRLICTSPGGKNQPPEKHVFDIPAVEVKNVRWRLEKAGWKVQLTEKQ
jgi:hypothetical protein